MKVYVVYPPQSTVRRSPGNGQPAPLPTAANCSTLLLSIFSGRLKARCFLLRVGLGSRDRGGHYMLSESAFCRTFRVCCRIELPFTESA